jgi:hypothetical protein
LDGRTLVAPLRGGVGASKNKSKKTTDRLSFGGVSCGHATACGHPQLAVGSSFASALYFVLFLWRFCAFLNTGSSKHLKIFFGGVDVKNLLPKKLRGKKPFSCRFSLRILFIAFLAVSLHEELKNTTKNIF